MNINTAFYLLAILREEFKYDVLKYPSIDEYVEDDECVEDFEEKTKEINVQALTVALKELSRSLTENFKSSMVKSSLVEDIFKPTGR